MPRKDPYRNACFTINNYTLEEELHLKSLHPKMSYLVWGKEIGEEGTPHLQGYVEFKEKTPFSKVKEYVGTRAHIEKRHPRSKPKQAAGYCKKGTCEGHIKSGHYCLHCQDYNNDYEFFFARTIDGPETWDGFEDGTITNQGKRTDITPVVEMITDGARMREVALTFPEQYVKYHKGFRDLRSLMLEPRSLSQMPQVIWLWGPTGTGKTRDAYIKFWPDESHYVWKPSNGNWWDGYDGESKIILDEFRAQMPWSDILGLLDRNEYRAPVKGGFVQIQADKFVITSPFPPEHVYKDDDRYDKQAQLLRRVTQVHFYDQVSG